MTSVKSIVGTILPVQFRMKLREQLVARNVEHLYGPRTIHVSKEEAVVTCVIKNGEYYIESFIKRYLQMGFRHIFFLDNGSSDQTLPIARSYANVSVCQSTLPISSHQRLFKKYLAERSVRGGWCLDADIDEFFDYPRSDVVSLREFLIYLNQNRYTAVVTQLLDMFSDVPLSHLTSQQKEDIQATYQYYDISDITKTEYLASAIVATYGKANRLADSKPALYWGGIRKTLYGNDCLLTKHSLFFPGDRIDLFPHVHFVNRANLADVSGVMLHYKLTSNAMAIALQNRDNFTENQKSYGAFVDLLQKESSRGIRKETAQKFTNSYNLVSSGLLVSSPAYERYAVEDRAATMPAYIPSSEELQWPAFKA